MNETGRTRYLILGLLAEGPASGYDIRKICQFRFRLFWSESYGQIYPSLKALETAGLIERLPGQGRRVEYRSTPAGKKALQDWLAQDAQPDTARSETLLKYYFSFAASPDQIRRNLEACRDSQERDIRELAGFQSQLHSIPDPHHNHHLALGIIDLGLRLAEVRAAWAGEQLARLDQINPKDLQP